MRSRFIKIISIAFSLALVIIYGCKKSNPAAGSVEPEALTPYNLVYPNYFPPLAIPNDNPLTVEGIKLGNKLYYDSILSNSGISCSSCHNAAESFSSYSVNSLAHVNLGWNNYFLWNGKISGSIEDIMKFEVEVFFNTNVSKLNNSAYYRDEFKKVYDVDVITSKDVAYALSQFFRVMVSANSLCDKFFQHTASLSASEMNGFILFTTEKGDCFHCHSLGLFTDSKFHNIGLDSVFTGVGMGRYNVTGNTADLGLFKTPTLRNIELTPPYMHDGRYLTLTEVVEHYNSKVKLSPTLDPIMTKPSKEFGLGLTPTQVADLVAFLKTLTDTTFTKNPLLAKPN